MTISFVRIDDRMIHGQTVTRWAKEYPCDGLVAVNNAAAGNAVLKQAYKAASDKNIRLDKRSMERKITKGIGFR